MYYKKTESNLPKEYVLNILNHFTCLNEFRHVENYYEKILSDYKSQIWNEYALTKYLTTEYPLILLESVGIKKESFELVRNIKSDIVPHFNHDLNASIILSKEGTPTIFFSEKLYALIWNHFSLRTQNKHDYAFEIYKVLKNNKPYHWNSSNLNAYKPIMSDTLKLNVSLAQLFIIMHEFSHLVLGHLKNTTKKLFDFDFENLEFEAFAILQEDELDADMFASDMYLAFLKHSFRYNYFDFFQTGFDIIRCFTKIEHEIDSEMFGFNSSHPLPSKRSIYITLRHKEEYIKNGYEEMINKLEKGISNYPEDFWYDYKKDLGSHDYLKETSANNM